MINISTEKNNKLKLFALLAIIFFVISFVLLAKEAMQVKLSANYSQLFNTENEANAYREKHREIFGADDTLLIAIIEPENISSEFLLKIHTLTNQLDEIPEFIRVGSISNSSVIKSTEDEISVEPVFDFDILQTKKINDQEIDVLMLKMRQSALLNNRYLSASHQSFIILAELPAEFDSSHKVTPIAEKFKQSIIDAFEAEKINIQFSGVAFTRIGLMDLMKKDLSLLIPLCLLLIGFFLWFLYRAFTPIVMTYIVMAYSVVATLGFIHVLQFDLNQLTMIFPLVIMVVIIANVLHFLQFYYKEAESHKLADIPLIEAIKNISFASVLSCVTTSIGFFSLITSDMPILREFGLVLGVSLLISAISLTFLQPSLLLILQNNIAIKNYPAFFSKFSFNKKHLFYYLAIPVVLFIAAIFFLPNNQFDFYLEDMLAENHPQIIAARTLNQKYAGSLPLEISLSGEEGDFKKADMIRRIHLLQLWLSDRGIHDSLSLATIITELHRSFDQQGIPEADALVAQYLLLAEAGSDDVVLQLTEPSYGMTRIRAFMPDMGSIAFKKLQKDFDEYAANLFEDSHVKAKLTGEMPLVYDGFDKLTKELLFSLLLAMVAILFVLAVIFKNMHLLLASIFPNVLPILLGLAFYSFFDQGLNPLPAIAFCIGIGIAVDDTIHLFSRYQHFIKQGIIPEQAITKAVESSAPALILSSIVLCFGFLLFLLSGFTWNQELGLLMGFIIICALLADLYVTPACIHLLTTHKKS